MPPCLCGEIGLSQANIKQCQPVLKRLQSEAAKDTSDPEGSESPFGKVVRVVFDIGIHRHPDARDKAGYQPYPKRKDPGVLKTVDESTTNKRRRNIAHRTNDRSSKLTRRKPGTTKGDIVDSRAHAARIGEYLAGGDERGKRDGVFEAQTPVKPGGETKSADGTEKSFPRQRIMVQSTSGSTEFN